MKKYSELMESVSQKRAVVSVVAGLPSKDHADLIDHNLSLPGDHIVKVSHERDNQTNPADVGSKIKHLQAMYPKHRDIFSPTTREEPTIYHTINGLHKNGYSHLTVVTSDDNKKDLNNQLQGMNGEYDDKGNGFKFKVLKVVSAVSNDPDKSKLQDDLVKHATSGKLEQFKKALHFNSNTDGHARAYMKSIRKGLELNEDFEYSNLRDSYINEEKFKVGDVVETNDGELAEIISRGSNYVTLIAEGKSPFKKWLTDIKESEGKAVKRDQLYKESFTIKGYRTKNFTRELSESFSEVAKKNDSFATYNAVVCLDTLLNITEEDLQKNYRKHRIQFDRIQMYMEKIGIYPSEIKGIEDKFIEHILVTEGYVRFSMADKMKVARLIANAVNVKTKTTDPVELINDAVRVISGMNFSMAGWQTIGKLINIASDSDIPWNRQAIPKQLASRMGLK